MPEILRANAACVSQLWSLFGLACFARATSEWSKPTRGTATVSARRLAASSAGWAGQTARVEFASCGRADGL